MPTDQSQPTFVADVGSPERRRLLLYPTGVERSSFGSFPRLGWAFIAIKLSLDGEELPLADHWEETFLEILRYPEDYSDQPLDWRWEATRLPADLRSLQAAFDASERFETAIETRLSPDGVQRLCFNLYDDGSYRFTLEQLITEGELHAWAPRDWSGEYPDLPSAEGAARRAFGWLDR